MVLLCGAIGSQDGRAFPQFGSVQVSDFGLYGMRGFCLCCLECDR